MKSNYNLIRDCGVYKPEPKKDWAFDPSGQIIARYKNKLAGNKTSQYREIKPPLPSPREVRMRLQSRLIIADKDRVAPPAPAPAPRQPVKFFLLLEVKSYRPMVEIEGEEKRISLNVLEGHIVGSNGHREEFSIVRRSGYDKVSKIRAKVARVCGDKAAQELDNAIVSLYL